MQTNSNCDKHLSIVLPTYNEKDNVLPLLVRIKQVLIDADIKNAEIIVVDDNSPDGTAEKIKENIKSVRVITRKHKRGLASAIMDGVKKSSGKYICVMDSDMSHPPELISCLYFRLKNGFDLVVASRHAAGGGIEEWPLNRRTISFIARTMCFPVTQIRDPLSGFFVIKRSVLSRIRIKPRGYKLLLDILVRGNIDRPVEVPYLFRNRRYGSSKLNAKTMVDFVVQLLIIYCYKIKLLVIK